MLLPAAFVTETGANGWSAIVITVEWTEWTSRASWMIVMPPPVRPVPALCPAAPNRIRKLAS
jgi:hypothetical protein